MHRIPKLLVTALVLVFGGGLLASMVQRSGGDVQINDIRFPATGGLTMSALLYVPANATAATPAPGVLAVHGYINSRETQSPYAIELARRGYVVLAIDQTGHGYSSPPAFANGYGGPDGLAYLRTLPMVNKDQIVLEGHSMGGWASLIAAASNRTGYRTIAISGSSTGTLGAPDGDAKFPRNLGLVYALYDEFSGLMWGSPIPRDVVQTKKMETLFGTDQPVEIEHLYGSIAQGSARKLYQPHQTHPSNHITTIGVADVLDWIQATSTAPHPLPPEDQTWYWKELGTLLALIGAVLLMFAVGGLLLETRFWSDLRAAPPEARGASGALFWLGVVLTVVVPVLLYFPVQTQAGKLIQPSALLPQNLTTGLMAWALCTGLVSLGLFLAWHFTRGRAQGASTLTYGLTTAAPGGTPRLVLRSLALAVVVVLSAYVALILTDLLFKTDFRFWVVAAKPLAWLHVRIALDYVIPFTAYFLLLGVVLHGQLRAPGSQPTRAMLMLRDAALTGGGFVLLLLYQYVPLLGGNTLALPEQALLSIVAFQLVIVLPVVGLISSYFFTKTGHVYVGAFVNGLFVTWLLVGGQATHYAF
jgi:pimeloyl-ACP methyl ester carboxylesterase